VRAPRSPQEQLAGFIARYDPEIGALARSALARLRKRLPGAVELVYDNYNALVVGFGPTERTSEAILSIALYPRWVSLFFLQGATLPDPGKVLKGSGTRVRHIVLESAATLEKPAVRALIAHALERAAKPLDGTRRGRIVIRSISAKQRPRRPAARRVPRVRGH
jgi:hypothetical protein